MKWILVYTIFHPGMVHPNGAVGYWDTQKDCLHWGWDWMERQRKEPSWMMDCFTEEEILEKNLSITIVQSHR